MSPNAKRDRGRDRNPVLDGQGNVVPGLGAVKYRTGKDGEPQYRYYVQGTRPIVWLSTTYATALVKLREYQLRTQGKGAICVPMGEFQETGITYSKPIPAADFWPTVAEQILAKPIESLRILADLTHLPFDRLECLAPKAESMNLKTIGQLYFGRPEGISRQTKRDAINYWQQFCKLVDVKTVAACGPDEIKAYKTKVLTDYSKDKKSSAYVKARFNMIRTIFNYALKQGKDIDAIQRVLTLCKSLESPTREAFKPTPIKRKDFTALLNPLVA